MSWNEILRMILGRQEGRAGSEEGRSENKKAQPVNVSPSNGIATQFNGTSPGGARKQLIIGLDFGTAFTKVVVSDGLASMAVPLNGAGDSIDDYLLPSTYWIGEYGITSIGRRIGTQVVDLKLALIKGKISEDQLTRIAVFMAHVLRRVRAFVLDRKASIYRGFYLDWLLNLGLPTDIYQDDDLKATYRKLGQVAWLASATDGDIVEGAVRSMLRYGFDQSDAEGARLDADAVTVFPEFVAQVTGYVRSPLRRSDLHLLVDVGAGTLDVTVFNVHERDDEDLFPIFAKAVKPLGTRFLVKHRIGNALGKELKEVGELGPYAAIPINQRFAALLGIDTAGLAAIDNAFLSQVTGIVGELLRFTKARKYPMSRRWEDGVPLFLCGGGAKCDFYRDALLGKGAVSGFVVKGVDLPKPDALEAPGVSMRDYDRLSVAYGLAFDPYDIGTTVAVDDVLSDAPLSASAHSGICPTCDGNGGLHRSCVRCGGSGYIAANR